ncbi:MAG: hypothetical protein PHH07_02180 [Candidatus Cloacimonetes bacterium]|nr:hypothetical protein [Candidatus Cloacimonadota bacterium]
MTRTIYVGMTILVYILWVLVVVGMLVIINAIATNAPSATIWAAGGATIGCAILAVFMNAVAAIGKDIYAIRAHLVGEDAEESEEKK